MNENQKKRKSILIIDDDKSINDIIFFFLKEKGYEVASSLRAKEGLNLAREGDFDLVVLDVMMPGMDGYKALEVFKSEVKLHKIPVLFLTAKQDFLETEKGKMIEMMAQTAFKGRIDFAYKPFKKDSLLRKIKELLSRGTTEKFVEGDK